MTAEWSNKIAQNPVTQALAKHDAVDVPKNTK